MMQTVQLRALALMLDYPLEDLREHALELAEIVAGLEPPRPGRGESLRALATHLAEGDLLDVQAEYVETFDRGRSTCLNLFEHLLGDSRERGRAMVGLLAHYERAGLSLTARQLPDYLPVYLEYASVLEPAAARDALRLVVPALVRLAAALDRRASPWLAPMAAAVRLAGTENWRVAARAATGCARSAAAAADDSAPAALDAAWAEQPVNFLDASPPQCPPMGVQRPVRPDRDNPAAGV